MPSAHDQLERQLKDTVAQASQTQPARPWLRSYLIPSLAGALVVLVVAAIVGAVVIGTHGRHSAPQALQPTTTSSAIPKPPIPGPLPKNVDDDVIANSFTVTWKKDPLCSPARGMTTQSASPPSTAMLTTLPVLKRAGTSSDQPPEGRGGLPFIDRQGGVLFSRYVRRALQADGATYYLFPLGDLGNAPLSDVAANRCYTLLISNLTQTLPTIPAAKRTATLNYGLANYAEARYNLETARKHDGVFLYQRYRDGGGGGSLLTLSQIKNGGPLGGGGGGKPYRQIVMDGVVPAGVASVSLQFPKTTYRGRTLVPLTVIGDVINNVFVIKIPSLFERGGWPVSAVWRSATGSLIKRINERPFHP